ncbi:SRPBCC family protein [Flavobacterium sp.]|uniref:SRPBCC family protein n=1 Tax=Flavobacterium sp. TaxID=239 RepID=UPI0028BEF48F|nr:GyrI-like domain-containing protein [Flavobacterium sp.]
MRIVKYIFLLILLAAIAVSVYIGTQSNKFDIQRSKVIAVDQRTLFEYVDEYRNWENWGPWAKEDPSMQYTYSSKTKGEGASYSWTGKDGDGKMNTVKTITNDSIFQKISFEDSTPSDVIWGFEKVNGGTKVTWRMKGEMDFMMKAFAMFSGGAEKMMAPMFEEGLNNIDTKLVKEINNYKVEVHGLVRKPGENYIKQSLTCKITSLSHNMGVLMRNITKFAEDNNIKVTGAPFAIYNTYNEATGITSFSVCLPVEQEIFTSEGSDISGGKFGSYLALKTTLKGDYSHSKKAWDKAYEEITKKHWVENPTGKYLEVYKVGLKQTPRPSEWVTEIYIPIVEKAKPIVKPLLPNAVTSDTTNVQ